MSPELPVAENRKTEIGVVTPEFPNSVSCPRNSLDCGQVRIDKEYA